MSGCNGASLGKADGKADMNISDGPSTRTTRLPRCYHSEDWISHRGKWRNSVKRAMDHMLRFIKTNSKNVPVLVIMVVMNFLISLTTTRSPDMRHGLRDGCRTLSLLNSPFLASSMDITWLGMRLCNLAVQNPQE